MDLITQGPLLVHLIWIEVDSTRYFLKAWSYKVSSFIGEVHKVFKS